MDINPKLRLYADTYNDKGYSSVTHLSNALLTQSEILSPVVTHLFGSDKTFGSKNFPLTFLTEGMKNVESLNSIDYKYPVIGRPKKTSAIAKNPYASGDKPGVGRGKFKVYFLDRWFHKSLTLMTPSKVIVRVQEEPRQMADGTYEYTCQLMNPNPSAFVPLTDFTVGKLWGRVIAKVGIEDSRGVESRSFQPSWATNQLSLVRDSYRMKGNVQSKVMVIEIKADGKTFKYWVEWELYLRLLEWREKCETDLWYSEYNKGEDGVIHVIDEDSGAIVTSGAGVIQQIPNEDSYSFMTEKKLKQIITDTFYNANDATAVNVEIFTGLGGLDECDSAMKAAASGFTLVDSKMISGEGRDLVFGAYFKAYRHVDGHMVTFRHLPMLDTGVAAEVSEKHPISGRPLESYSMYILDMSTYEGKNNLTYVTEKGREDIEFSVAGVKVPPGYPATQYRASDRDSTSIHWMKSQGIQIKRPTNCVKIYCKIS
jgi:hypothetical protein